MSGALPWNLAITLGRVAAAFALSLVLGSALGIAMGRSRRLDLWLDNAVTVLLNLPALVLIVLIYVWFGLNEVAAIAAVALNKLPNTVVTMREGARALDPALAEMARSFRMSRWRTLRHVILPQLTPYVFAAARSGLALIWKIVLVVELLGRSNGVGFQIQIYFQLFDVTLILAYTLAFILVVQADRVGRGAAAGTLGDAMAEVILRLRIERKSFRTGAASCRCWAGSSSRWVRARSSPWSGRPAVARRRCCGSSAAWIPSSRARSTGVARAIARIGTVFQEPRLLPWRTVRENLLLAQQTPNPELADALLRSLDLAAFRDAFPRTLSLGMARRVAIARAFAIEPELVLLDEPFVSLDAAMAARSQELLLDAWHARPTAVLLVTHDLLEAEKLADRIVTLSDRPAHVLREMVPAGAPRDLDRDRI